MREDETGRRKWLQRNGCAAWGNPSMQERVDVSDCDVRRARRHPSPLHRTSRLPAPLLARVLPSSTPPFTSTRSTTRPPASSHTNTSLTRPPTTTPPPPLLSSFPAALLSLLLPAAAYLTHQTHLPPSPSDISSADLCRNMSSPATSSSPSL
nr:hypothetical protein CFP56_11322 [Quercus suber]